MFSSISARAPGRRTARPRRRRARPAARRRRSAPASASDSVRRGLRVADAHLDRAEAEVRAHRPPDLRVLDDRVGAHEQVDVVVLGLPGAERVRERRSAGSDFVKICVRAECRPAVAAVEERRVGADRQQQRQHGPQAVADARRRGRRRGRRHGRAARRCCCAARRTAGRRRRGGSARCRCWAARGSRPTGACRSRRARRRGAAASANSRRRASRWRAIASARSSPRPERISISDEISSPAIDVGAAPGPPRPASRSSSKRGTRSSVAGSRIANSSSMPDRAVGRGREGLRGAIGVDGRWARAAYVR